jgi:hypothetical protein
MSDTSTSSEPGKYVAEFVDGPLQGTTEHRFLQDGEPETSVTQVALVNRTDALFVYVAGETRELNGELYVSFSLDKADSDPLQGEANQDVESHSI